MKVKCRQVKPYWSMCVKVHYVAEFVTHRGFGACIKWKIFANFGVFVPFFNTLAITLIEKMLEKTSKPLEKSRGFRFMTDVFLWGNH